MYKRRAREAAAALGATLISIFGIAAGLGSASPAVAASEGKPKVVVSMGDSMISGDGSRWKGNSLSDTGSRDGTDRACKPGRLPGSCSSDDNSSIYLDGTEKDQCLRSDIAEVMSAHIPGLMPVNLACAGAVTTNLLTTSAGGQPQDGEPTQGDKLEAVARNDDVKMIVVSIGINDLDGGGSVVSCAEAYFEAQGSCVQAQAAKLKAATAATITKVERVVGNIRSVMSAAGYRRRSYRLVLQSYPDTLAPGNALRYPQSDRAEKINDGCPFYNRDATWIHNGDFALIASIVRRAAAATGVEYMNLLNLFAHHEVCSIHDRLVTASSPPSPITSEWARFFSLTQVELQAVPSGSTTVPARYLVIDALDEILHPGYFGQLALGHCLRSVYAAPIGDHTCTSRPDGTSVSLITTRFRRRRRTVARRARRPR